MTTNHPVPTPPPAEPASSLRPVEEIDAARLAAMNAWRQASGALRDYLGVPEGAYADGFEVRVGCVIDDLGRMSEAQRRFFLDVVPSLLARLRAAEATLTDSRAAQAQLAEAPSLWSCPDCAFTFDAGHTDADGGYSCPLCGEIAAEARLEAVRAIAAKAAATLRVNDPFCVGMDIADELLAALSAAPQPEPDDLLLRALPTHLAYISRTVTASYPAGMDPELVMRRRVGKVNVESGELADAIEGYTGENPRKGVYAKREDVVKELIDCASASLCAVEHMTGDRGEALGMLAAQVAGNAQRLSESIPDRCVDEPSPSDNWRAADAEQRRREDIAMATLPKPEPPASDEPARNRCTCDRAKEGAAYHHPTCPSHIGDEPARCEHDFHATNRAGERIGLRLAGAGSSERCPAASGTPDGGS